MSDFFQIGPSLGNQYDDDAVLQAYLRWKLPSAMLAEIEPGLHRIGDRAASDILALGDEAEANPPRHVPYNSWGRRVDRIEVCPAWEKLQDIAAEEGVVATAYERGHGAWSRIHQFALLYLYGPSSAVATCPLAMTDGAARVLELHANATLRARIFSHLTTRDPSAFWTSGQWMTERTGGSDVAGTSTIARREGDNYRLYGTKWFTSATTSPIAMTLARTEGAAEGSRGLSLFCLETRDGAGSLRNVRIHRLKDKLGTRALPTAELTMEGTPATLIGGIGQGVRTMTPLLNITRAYNACCAAGFMRRGIALARDYAHKRHAFGKKLADQPLHQETLATLDVEFCAAFMLVFRVAELLGRDECGEASDDEKALLRLLTPVVKLYTAKQAIAVSSEVLECFGGAGYIEDTGLPRLLRDAQVLSIWEGTTNVLSLDVLRALDKDRAWRPFLADLRQRLDRATPPALRSAPEHVREAAQRLEAFAEQSATGDTDAFQAAARAFAFGLARTYAGALLLEFASAPFHAIDNPYIAIARRWCGRQMDLIPAVES